MANGKHAKCECGHHKAAHYSKYESRGVGCHAVAPDGIPYGCKCVRSSEQVEREFGKGE